MGIGYIPSGKQDHHECDISVGHGVPRKWLKLNVTRKAYQRRYDTAGT